MPCAFSYKKELADGLSALKAVGIEIESAPEKAVLLLLTGYTTELAALTIALSECVEKLNEIDDAVEQASFANKNLLSLLEKTRVVGDAVETYIPDHKWPFPKYTKLFF
jgi:glutamine synthetase